MSEFKFKAWDKINNKWINLWYFVFAIDGSIMGIYDLDGELYGLHQVQLVPYMGVLDSQRVEIFKGDILEVENAFGKHTYTVEDLPDFYIWHASNMLGGMTTSAYTVIGNVWEKEVNHGCK